MIMEHVANVTAQLEIKRQPTSTAAGDTESSEWIWLTEAEKDPLVKRSIKRSGSAPKWALPLGIPVKRVGWRIFLGRAELDSWRAAEAAAETKKASGRSKAESVTTGTSDGSTAKLDAIAEKMDRLLLRMASLENSLLLVEQRIGQPAEPDAAEYHDLSVIGREHLGGLSAIRLNRILIGMKLQEETLKGGKHDKYLLTQAGKEHGYAFQKHVAKNGFQARHVRWKLSVVPLIKTWLAESRPAVTCY